MVPHLVRAQNAYKDCNYKDTLITHTHTPRHTHTRHTHMQYKYMHY